MFEPQRRSAGQAGEPQRRKERRGGERRQEPTPRRFRQCSPWSRQFFFPAFSASLRCPIAPSRRSSLLACLAREEVSRKDRKDRQGEGEGGHGCSDRGDAEGAEERENGGNDSPPRKEDGTPSGLADDVSSGCSLRSLRLRGAMPPSPRPLRSWRSWREKKSLAKTAKIAKGNRACLQVSAFSLQPSSLSLPFRVSPVVYTLPVVLCALGVLGVCCRTAACRKPVARLTNTSPNPEHIRIRPLRPPSVCLEVRCPRRR